MNLKLSRQDLKSTLLESFSSRRKIFLVALASTLVYSLLVSLSFPTYSWQMISASLTYLDDVIVALTLNLYHTAGAWGIILSIFYSFLTGVAITDILATGRSQGLASITPGVLAGGCATCGAGVIGLLGFSSALLLLPFSGNLLRLSGIILVLMYLSNSEKEKCSL